MEHVHFLKGKSSNQTKGAMLGTAIARVLAISNLDVMKLIQGWLMRLMWYVMPQQIDLHAIPGLLVWAVGYSMLYVQVLGEITPQATS